MEQVSITRHEQGHRGEYQAHVEGADAIGRLIWSETGGVRSADSTQVPEAIGGRGIAGKLVDALIEDARAQGFKVKPACSYVEKAFDRHPEWAGLRA